MAKSLQDMATNWQEGVQHADQNYQAAKGRMVANYRGPEGVSIGPNTRAKYERGVQRARLTFSPDSAQKFIRNYVDALSR